MHLFSTYDQRGVFVLLVYSMRLFLSCQNRPASKQTAAREKRKGNLWRRRVDDGGLISMWFWRVHVQIKKFVLFK